MRALASLAVAALLLGGCDREPVRPWSAADHDQPASAPSSAIPQRRAGVDDAVALAWQKQCASCHGVEGRGDGPSGPENGAPDMTQPAWQASLTDEQMVESITKGKGKMPRFDMPPVVANALVRYIRQRKAR